VSGVAAQIGAGSAAIQISGGSGALAVTAGGAAGSARGQAQLVGVPGFAVGGTLALSFDNTIATPTFSIAGTGALTIPGFLNLSGSLSFSTSGSGATRSISLSITSTSPSLSATVNIAADGSVLASGQVSGALPSLFSGLTMSGTVTLQVNTSSSDQA